MYVTTPEDLPIGQNVELKTLSSLMQRACPCKAQFNESVSVLIFNRKV